MTIALGNTPLQAQKITAQERSQLKAELKTFGRNLPLYKAFSDSISTMKVKLTEKEAQVAKIESEFKKRENELRDKKTLVKNLLRELQELYNQSPAQQKHDIYMKFQIGAFENTTATRYLDNLPEFVDSEIYQDEAGKTFKGYTVGYFSNVDEARTLWKYLLMHSVPNGNLAAMENLGIKDLFEKHKPKAQIFIRYYDSKGKRLSVKDLPSEYL